MSLAPLLKWKLPGTVMTCHPGDSVFVSFQSCVVPLIVNAEILGGLTGPIEVAVNRDLSIEA